MEESKADKEVRSIEKIMGIENMDSNTVVLRFPFWEDNEATVNRAGQGLGELAGCLNPEIPLEDGRGECHPCLESVVITKSDYMRTYGYLDCSDSLIELWWHW